MKFFRNETRRYEIFVKNWPHELEGHGHAGAALVCMGFSFEADITRLKEWLAINAPQILTQLHF